jgi:hypothetical protein
MQIEVHLPLYLKMQARRRLKLVCYFSRSNGIHETNSAVLVFLFPLLGFRTLRACVGRLFPLTDEWT